MVFKPKKLTVAVMVALGVVSLAQAQTATTEKTVVTGSNIRRVDSETPSVVQVITAEEIRSTGSRDLGEVLRNIAANSAGGQTDQSSNSFSSGATSVSLRGLGSASTLLLVNGRRISPSAYADPNLGKSTIYNLSTIPIDAIERIEVLKDGASAIYGSDALAGVVNIILRRDYRGAELSTSYSADGDNLWSNWRTSVTAGFGDIVKDRYNALVSFEHFHRDPVSIFDVKNVPIDELVSKGGWRTTQSSNGFPANYFRESKLGNGNFTTFVRSDAACPPTQIIGNRCRYNSYNDLNSVFKLDRDSVFSRLSFDVTPTVNLFGEFGYSRTKYDYFSTPAFTNNVTGSIWADSLGNLRNLKLVLPVGHPDNPTTVPVAAAYTYADLGRRAFQQSNDSFRALAGVKAQIAGWDLESALLWSSDRRKEDNTGYLYYPGIVAALADQSYRFNGSNSPATIDKVRTGFSESGKATVTIWDLKGTRELMNLAGGPMGIAVGVEARKEELTVTPDAKIVAGDIVGRGTSAVDGSRNVQALYAELSVPFLKNVESQLAVRSEHYSDFGNSTTPKIGLKWTVLPTLAVRGTWGKGFRAPGLSQISNSSVQAFNNGVEDPLRCPVTGATTDCSASFSAFLKSNPALKPEKSDNFTLGFVVSPANNFNVSVDYWNIKKRAEIGTLGTTFLLANESSYPGAIIRDPNPASWLPGVPNSGPIFAVRRQFFNLTTSEADGIDLDASLKSSL
ncbi:MAG: TonB-dependent receptor, partial [Casimicrobiaceae bacterium]